jgi:hypothetical protein
VAGAKLGLASFEKITKDNAASSMAKYGFPGVDTLADAEAREAILESLYAERSRLTREKRLGTLAEADYLADWLCLYTPASGGVLL